MNKQVKPSIVKQNLPEWWANNLNWQEWWQAKDNDGTWKHPFKSPNMPKGYNTVLGYFWDYTPTGADVYDDERGNATLDPLLIKIEQWCVKYAAKFGLIVHDVEAPEVLKSHGIMTLKAFPTALLDIPIFEDVPG